MNASEPLTYEQALVRLDDTLRALEDGKLTLEEAIAAVARGREYLQICQQKLDEARRRIEILPVTEEPVPEEEPPHPATVAQLRRENEGGSKISQSDIPF